MGATNGGEGLDAVAKVLGEIALERVDVLGDDKRGRQTPRDVKERRDLWSVVVVVTAQCTSG